MTHQPWTNSGELTQMLNDARNGDRNAYAQVYEQLYAELKRCAQAEISARPAHTLSATALVHEAFLKLNTPDTLSISSRRHFLRICVRAMRQVLVDHFRARQTDKRGGDWIRTPVDLDNVAQDADAELANDIGDALDRLRQDSPRVAEVIEFKFFLGLAETEIAQILDISERTVRNDWTKGRLWLARALNTP